MSESDETKPMLDANADVPADADSNGVDDHKPKVMFSILFDIHGNSNALFYV